MIKNKKTLFKLAMVGLLVTPSLVAVAQDKKTSPAKPSNIGAIKKNKDKLLIEADRINQDKKNNIIRAEGNVKVFYDGQLLKSDRLVFDKAKNKLTASGNVYFKDDKQGPSQRIIVSQEIEMVGSFKSGVSKALVGRLGNHSSITASESRWENGNRIYKDVSYTNCYLCSPFGDNVPLWRMRADTAVEDKETDTLQFSNAWLEILNVPIFYSPYFSFKKNRGSGFLLPSFKSHSNAGFIFRPKAFVVFSDYSDLLFNPYFTSEQGMIGSLVFRQRFARTNLNIGGVVLYDTPDGSRPDRWQGYIYFDFLRSLNKEWKIAAAGHWASLQNFFQRYTFLNNPGSPGNDLITYIAATGYISPHYVKYSSYYYQDNRLGNPFDKILVAPRVEFFGRGSRTESGGQWRVDGDLRYYIEPNQGTSALLHFSAGWQQPIYFLNGMVLNINAGLRFDYITSHFYETYYNTIPGISIPGRDPTLPSLGGNSHSTTRFIPEILTTLSYPLIARNKKNNLIIEPVVGVYFSFGGLIDNTTNGGNNGGDLNDIIFATDSSPLEINSDNLFLLDRVLGTSYYEDYGRVAYGVNINNILKSGGEYNLFLGYGHNFFEDQNPYVPNDLRFNKSSTNIIFNASWRPGKYLTVSNSMLLFGNKDFAINRHVGRLDLNYQNINFGLSYFYYQNEDQLVDGKLRQIVPALIVRIGDNWQLRWQTTADILEPNFRIRSMSMGISYSDECWYMAFNAYQVFPNANVSDTGGWQFGLDWRIVAF